MAENVTGGNLVVNYQLLEPGTTTLATATQPVSFEYDLIDETTVKGTDYTENTYRTETIAIGSSTGSFSIPITDDDLLEGNEIFTLELSNLVNGSIFTGSSITQSQEIIIVDNELPTLSIAKTPLTVVENIGAQGLVVEVMLSGPRNDYDPSTDLDVTIDYTLTADTATEGLDYTQPVSRTVTIPEGMTAARFTIPILDDSVSPVAEGNETFDINLTITSGAKFGDGGTTKTQTITILDDDPPILTFHSSQLSVFENIETAAIVVRVDISTATYQDVTLNYSLSDVSSTKGVDYIEEVTREVTIFTGGNRGTFSIPIIDDLVNEGDETFTLTLSNLNNAIFANNDVSISKTITIVDNEPPILRVSAEEFKVDENVGSDGFEFDIELSGPTRKVVSLVYDLIDETATERRGLYRSAINRENSYDSNWGNFEKN